MAVRDPLGPAFLRHNVSARATTAAPQDLAAAELLGHSFARPELLREALMHRSALQAATSRRGRNIRSTGAGSNERLEFVGDRVLGLVMAEWLAERYPDEQEGQLGPRLALLVSQPVLAEIAERIGLPALLWVGSNEAKAGVRRRATVLADAMEAAIGALYLDAGLEPARRFVRRVWGDSMTGQLAPPKDSKSALQEYLLARGAKLPDYQVVSREGPPHDPIFIIAAHGLGQSATGTAGSKQMAERLAAAALLAQLQQEPAA
jgi:ribonuclease-3